MPAAAVRILALLIGLAAFALLAVTGRAVVIGLLRRGPSASATGAAPVAARPLAEYEPASEDAVAALAASLAAGDEAVLPAAAVRAKNALMGLTVPAAAREAHLALILALTRFEQDPSPEARAALVAAVEAFSS